MHTLSPLPCFPQISALMTGTLDIGESHFATCLPSDRASPMKAGVVCFRHCYVPSSWDQGGHVVGTQCCPRSTCSVRSASACGWTASAPARSAAPSLWTPCAAGRMGPPRRTSRCIRAPREAAEGQPRWVWLWDSWRTGHKHLLSCRPPSSTSSHLHLPLSSWGTVCASSP